MTHHEVCPSKAEVPTFTASMYDENSPQIYTFRTVKRTYVRSRLPDEFNDPNNILSGPEVCCSGWLVTAEIAVTL